MCPEPPRHDRCVSVSRNGYKMCIRAYLNGDGSGYNTHLSLFFVLMKGEYDALLRWPFDYKVSMILVGKEGGCCIDWLVLVQ